MEVNQEIWGESRRLKLTSKFMRLSLTWKPTEKESLSVQYSQLRFFEPYVVMLLLKKWFKKPTKKYLGYWGDYLFKLYWETTFGTQEIYLNPLTPQDLVSNSPKWLPYNSYDFSSENLLFDQLISL